nr:MAG TPA: hypothetical protein [Caudoviricetes sp.]
MSSKLGILKVNVMRKIAKNKPEIYFGVGIACGAGAIACAFRAGTKAKDILETSKKEISEVHEVWNNDKISEEVYSEKDYKKDLVIAYGRAAGRVAKAAAPVLVFANLSLAFLSKSNRIHKARSAAFGLAYSGLSDHFDKYRERVIKEVGEEADKMYMNDIYKKDIEIEEVNEKGETKTKKIKNAKVINRPPEEYSPFAKFFDEGCPNFRPDRPEDNLMFLRSQERYANDILHTRGYIFLNEVYESLGIPLTESGQYVGWMLGNGDDMVDFGIYDIYKEANRDFVNGYEPVILLDFNVDGVISNLL